MAPPNPSSTTPSTTTSTSHSLPRLKSSFLTTQIRLLNTPLTLPPNSSSIPPATLTTVLDKINKKLTTHNKLAYSVESQRHVVEQVDGVYWRDVLASGVPVDKAETVVRRDVDLTGDAVALVPGMWEDVVLRDDGADEGERRGGKRRRVDTTQEGDGDEGERAERFALLHAQLRSRIRRREELRQKTARYKKLKGLIELFGDPKTDVQPNLVTRDNAELESEMARMRVLLARVGSKMQAGESDVERVEDEDVGHDERPADTTRLEAVLGLG